MAAAATLLARNPLTATLTTVQYTATGNGAILTNIVLSNTSASAVAVTVSLRGYTTAANSANADVALLPAVSVPANSVVSFDVKQVLTSGQTILAGAATNAVVNIHASGVVL